MLTVLSEFMAGSEQATRVLTQAWLDDFGRRSRATKMRHQAVFRRWRKQQVFNGTVSVLGILISAVYGGAVVVWPFIVALWVTEAARGVGLLQRFRQQHLSRALESDALEPAQVRERYAIESVASLHPVVNDYVMMVAASGRSLTQGEAQMLLHLCMISEGWLPREVQDWTMTPYHQPLSVEHIQWQRERYEQMQSERLRTTGVRFVALLFVTLAALMGSALAGVALGLTSHAYAHAVIAAGFFAVHVGFMPAWMQWCRDDAHIVSQLPTELRYQEDTVYVQLNALPERLRAYVSKVQQQPRRFLVQEWNIIRTVQQQREKSAALRQVT